MCEHSSPFRFLFVLPYGRADGEEEVEEDHHVASYRIRPQFSQLTISFPALALAAVALVTFIWQPVQTPCSIATIAASPLLLKRRSKRPRKSSSILPSKSARSLVNSSNRDSNAFDFSSRSAVCRAIDSLTPAAFFSSSARSSLILSACTISSSSSSSILRISFSYRSISCPSA